MKDPNFDELEKEVHLLGTPYHCDTDRAEELQKEVERWLKCSDNDCLRARGDWRWLKMCELDSKLKILMAPF